MLACHADGPGSDPRSRKNVISIFFNSYTNISLKRKFYQFYQPLPQNGFNNLLPTVQETNHFTEEGWLKKIKCMVQYPVYDMHHKNELISEVSFGNLYIFKRSHVLQMFFFNLAACSSTNNV